MPGIEMFTVDLLADIDVVIIDDHPFVVPAELVGEGGPQTPGTDNGNPALIRRQRKWI